MCHLCTSNSYWSLTSVTLQSRSNQKPGYYIMYHLGRRGNGPKYRIHQANQSTIKCGDWTPVTSRTSEGQSSRRHITSDPAMHRQCNGDHSEWNYQSMRRSHRLTLGTRFLFILLLILCHVSLLDLPMIKISIQASHSFRSNSTFCVFNMAAIAAILDVGCFGKRTFLFK
jgi:hypothetical protein